MAQAVSTDFGRDINVIKLARELAIDHYTVDQILEKWGIDGDTWLALQEWPRFQELVEHEKQVWNAALNAPQRIRLKSAVLIEEWMEEGDRLLHDRDTSFSSKIELLKLLGKFSLLDAPEKIEGTLAGGRVSITINMGGKELEYEGEEILEAQVVEESDPNVVDFDWEEEFEANPTIEATIALEEI